MQKYKGFVILSDLDGTLLTNDKKVSYENKSAIEYFIENGGKFSIATGRPIYTCSQYIKDLKTDLPAIVYNGGTLYDCNSNKIIKEDFLEDSSKNIPFKISKEYSDIGISIYVNKDIYVVNEGEFTCGPHTLNMNMNYNIPSNIFSLHWNTILFSGDNDKLVELQEYLTNQYDSQIVRSGSLCFEILPKKVSKGNALKELVNMYKLDHTKTIAIGDNGNDIKLLEAAHIAMCPENASEAIKKYADFITVDNEHHIIPNILDYIDKNLI